MKSESSAEEKVTQERLKEVLHYSPETGEFVWKVQLSRRTPAGSKACKRPSRGRYRVCIEGVLYFAHRLTWLYVHGELPSSTIDHIDRDPSNNRISNLRIASDQQNKANRPSQNNSKPYRGVHRMVNRYVSQITYQGKSIYLGSFSCPIEAHERYKAKHLELHGEFSVYAQQKDTA